MTTTPTYKGYELDDLAFTYEAGELRSVTATIQVRVASDETSVDAGPRHPWRLDVNRIIDSMRGADNEFPQLGTSFDLENYPDVRLRGIFGRGFVLKNDSGDRARFYKVDLLWRFHPQTKVYPRRGSTGLQQNKAATGTNNEPFTVPLSDGTEKEVVIDRLDPQTSVSFSALIATNDPGGESAKWSGTINSSSWRGGDIGEWLCTNVDFELVDAARSTLEYEFTFDFEKKEGGWKGQTEITDSTGETAEVRFAEFENAYVRADFNEIIPGDPDYLTNGNLATV